MTRAQGISTLIEMTVSRSAAGPAVMFSDAGQSLSEALGDVGTARKLSVHLAVGHRGCAIGDASWPMGTVPRIVVGERHAYARPPRRRRHRRADQSAPDHHDTADQRRTGAPADREPQHAHGLPSSNVAPAPHPEWRDAAYSAAEASSCCRPAARSCHRTQGHLRACKLPVTRAGGRPRSHSVVLTQTPIITSVTVVARHLGHAQRGTTCAYTRGFGRVRSSGP
jgi:hypothetical protein